MVPVLESRLRGALWGLIAGDALASPTHWYYGGPSQIASDYGGPITTYVQPVTHMAGSIMNKSNINFMNRCMVNMTFNLILLPDFQSQIITYSCRSCCEVRT